MLKGEIAKKKKSHRFRENIPPQRAVLDAFRKPSKVDVR